MLDFTGHIALCDFGLCKLNMTESDKTNSTIPDYFPEPSFLRNTRIPCTRVITWKRIYQDRRLVDFGSPII